MPYLDFLESLDAILFDDVHLQFVPIDQILDIGFFLLQFFSLQLQLLEVFLDIIGLLRFLFDDLVAAGDAGGEVIDVALAHLAFSLVVLLALEVLCEVVEQHLSEGGFTVILLLRGYSSGSMRILRTL